MFQELFDSIQRQGAAMRLPLRTNFSEARWELFPLQGAVHDEVSPSA